MADVERNPQSGAAAAAQAILLNRLAKRDRLLKQLGTALQWANCALYATDHEQLTWGDLATIIEKSAQHFNDQGAVLAALRRGDDGEGEHETWAMVLVQMREWDRAGQS
jgi:hypothetical protein